MEKPSTDINFTSTHVSFNCREKDYRNLRRTAKIIELLRKEQPELELPYVSVICLPEPLKIRREIPHWGIPHTGISIPASIVDYMAEQGLSDVKLAHPYYKPVGIDPTRLKMWEIVGVAINFSTEFRGDLGSFYQCVDLTKGYMERIRSVERAERPWIGRELVTAVQEKYRASFPNPNLPST